MQFNNIDPYSRLQAPAFNELDIIEEETLFQTLFADGAKGGKTIITDAAIIDIQIQRGNLQKTAYIVRGTDATNISQNRSKLERFTEDAKSFPLLEEVTPITSEMIDKRVMGESIRNPFSRMKRQIYLSNLAHRQHIARIVRQKEFSAKEAFVDGIQTVAAGKAYDFYRRASHNYNAVTVWSDSANALPIDDLATGADLVKYDGHVVPTDVIMGDRDWQEFINTTQVKEIADNRRIFHFVSDMTIASPAGYGSWVRAGAAFQGTVKAGNWTLNLWTYPAEYDDDAGTGTRYLPDGTAIIFAKNARRDRYFGPKDTLEVNSSFLLKKFGISTSGMSAKGIKNAGIFSSEMFHLDAYDGKNNKVFNVRTQAAPIYVPVQTDAYAKLTT